MLFNWISSIFFKKKPSVCLDQLLALSYSESEILANPELLAQNYLFVNGNLDLSSDKLRVSQLPLNLKVQGSLSLKGQSDISNLAKIHLDVSDSLDISEMDLKRLPKLQHLKLRGNFNCSSNLLRDLKNCPGSIEGTINFSYNPIKTIKHLPKDTSYIKLLGPVLCQIEFDDDSYHLHIFSE